MPYALSSSPTGRGMSSGEGPTPSIACPLSRSRAPRLKKKIAPVLDRRGERREQAIDDRAATRSEARVAREVRRRSPSTFAIGGAFAGNRSRRGGHVNKKFAGGENRDGKDTGTVVKELFTMKLCTYVCCITACEFLSRFGPYVRL